MRNQTRGFTTLLVLFVLLAIILVGGGFYAFKNNGVPSPETTLTATSSVPVTATTSGAPSISNQKLKLVENEAGPTLPSPTTVTTTAGGKIALTLIMSFPNDGVLVGMYKYQSYLYKYSDGTFTYLPKSDAVSFTVMNIDFGFAQYAKDKNNVYCYGDILAGADAATFKIIPTFSLDSDKYVLANYWRQGGPGYITFQDKNHEYVYGECKPYLRS